MIKSLSFDERYVVCLINRKIPISKPTRSIGELVKSLGCSLEELVALADTLADISEFGQPTDGFCRGLNLLIKREWIKWTNKDKGSFYFKLCIILLWLRREKLFFNCTFHR